MDSPTKKPRQSGSGLSQLAAGLTKRLAKENPRPTSLLAVVHLHTVPRSPAGQDATDEILRLGASRASRRTSCPAWRRRFQTGPTPRSSCGLRGGVWSDLLWLLKPAFREAAGHA
ncbi:hypothetical protein ZWY2020_059671 [Hordeum vulgare]|nr:hypothetical protein ZWY2020_059671 [Hordeum vulgare]